MMRRLITVAVTRVNQCFHPCLDIKKIITKFPKRDLIKSECHNSTFQTTQMATRHLNETPHG